jgi:ornithine carbamoyltransferase
MNTPNWLRAIGRVSLWIWAALGLLFLFTPILITVIYSFNEPTGKYNYVWNKFSLAGWADPLKYPELTDALIFSLKIAIVGDLLHSRVLRSNVLLLTKLGADVWVCAPATLIPPGLREMGVTVTTRVDDAVEGADVIMMLRIQLERMQGAYFPSQREYFRTFGMTEARVARAKSDCIIMHPGPINRGVEIASEVADGTQSVILDQVANGVAVRMAVLYLLAGGGDGDPARTD